MDRNSKRNLRRMRVIATAQDWIIWRTALMGVISLDAQDYYSAWKLLSIYTRN